jgi:hypothetical protein
MIEFGGVRHELARDRIVRIVTVDQTGKRGGQSDGVARGDGVERFQFFAWRKAVFNSVRRGPKRLGLCCHDNLSIVMPGLVPGIHVFLDRSKQGVDGRNKSGHDA